MVTRPVEKIPAIVAQLDNLGQAVERVEKLIISEINQLKAEQIADLKKSIERLADDQRRLWEAVRSIENDRNQMYGGMRVIHAIVGGIGGALGGIATFIATKIFGGH